MRNTVRYQTFGPTFKFHQHMAADKGTPCRQFPTPQQRIQFDHTIEEILRNPQERKKGWKPRRQPTPITNLAIGHVCLTRRGASHPKKTEAGYKERGNERRVCPSGIKVYMEEEEKIRMIVWEFLGIYTLWRSNTACYPIR